MQNFVYVFMCIFLTPNTTLHGVGLFTLLGATLRRVIGIN